MAPRELRVPVVEGPDVLVGGRVGGPATAYDPAVLAEPWAKRARIATLTDQEIVQAPPCLERDLPIMNDASNHDNDR